MTPELSPEEARVLGCLVEKQLTTPQAYPLTDNALVAACSQTTGRDPVVQYDVPTVRIAVRSLRERELLRTVHRTGERSDKHLHLLDQALGLSGGPLALLALLLLRGPQTPGELRARSERMHPFASVDEVVAALEHLVEQGHAVRLDRQPGHKEARYADLLAPRAATPAAAPSPPPTGPTLAQQVEALRAEVAELRAEVERLRDER